MFFCGRGSTAAVEHVAIDKSRWISLLRRVILRLPQYRPSRRSLRQPQLAESVAELVRMSPQYERFYTTGPCSVFRATSFVHTHPFRGCPFRGLRSRSHLKWGQTRQAWRQDWRPLPELPRPWRDYLWLVLLLRKIWEKFGMGLLSTTRESLEWSWNELKSTTFLEIWNWTRNFLNWMATPKSTPC